MKNKFNFPVTLYILLGIPQILCSQPVWDSDILEKANTAKNTRYLKESEKQVIFYTNLARADGKLFAESYLKWYMESTGPKPDSFAISLEKELKNIRNLPMLYPDMDLYEIARNHAVKSGKSGKQGHQGFEKRFREINRAYYSYGENCYYGRDNPLNIVIELMIDKNVSDLGHRQNMLDPGFNSVGVSIMPHKIYGYNCVMDFGRKRLEELNNGTQLP
jgi:hypothetical protein